jgi:hypothetical protein
MRVRTALALAGLMAMIPALQPSLDAQLGPAPDNKYAGLQWRFVRIKYHYATEGTHVRRTSTASRGESMRRPPSRTFHGE